MVERFTKWGEKVKTQATPRPWKFIQDRHKSGQVINAISTGESNRWIARMCLNPEVSFEQEKANAELIVRAVNCHDELVQKLEEIKKIISEYPDLPDKKYKAVLTLSGLDDLLKRAKGEL